MLFEGLDGHFCLELGGVLFPCLPYGAKLLFFNLSTGIKSGSIITSPHPRSSHPPLTQLLRQHLLLTCEEGLEEID